MLAKSFWHNICGRKAAVYRLNELNHPEISHSPSLPAQPPILTSCCDFSSLFMER